MSDQSSQTFSRFNIVALFSLCAASLGFVLPPSFPTSGASSKIEQTSAAEKPKDDKPEEFATGEVPALRGIDSKTTGLWSDPFEGMERPRRVFPKPQPSKTSSVYELKPADEKSTKGSNKGGESQSPIAAAVPEVDLITPTTFFETCCSEHDYRALLSSDSNLKSLIVLPIMVYGENKRTEVESRTDYRHAVEHALSQEGWETPFKERMSFVWVNWCMEKEGQMIPFQAQVPLKLYHKGGTEREPKKDGVLVCWIDRRYLGDKPLKSIENVLEQILPVNVPDPCHIRILGPVYSYELKKIDNELKRRDENEKPNQCNKNILDSSRKWTSISLISHSATAPPDDLDGLKKHLSFESTIGRDSDVIDGLVSELFLRKRQYGTIVVVSEAGGDSPQSLANLFSKALEKKNLPTSFQLQYLKGVGAPDKSSEPVDDYFSRQLSSLAQGDSSIHHEDVSAVVILGDDVYDKLKLLRSVHRLFPNATAFTHDIHRFFELPENLPFCRGLVVASHNDRTIPEDFGPLGKKNRQSIKLRDAYQVSLFKACVLAVSKPDDERNLIKANRDSANKVSLHEIGFHGAHNLSEPSSQSTQYLLLLTSLIGIAIATYVIVGQRLPLQFVSADSSWFRRFWHQVKRFLRSASPWDVSKRFAPSENQANVDAGSKTGSTHSSHEGTTVVVTLQEDPCAEIFGARRCVFKEERKRLKEEGHWFPFLLIFRAEFAIAAICTGLVWRNFFWLEKLPGFITILFFISSLVTLFMGISALFPRRVDLHSTGDTEGMADKLYRAFGGGANGLAGFRRFDYYGLQVVFWSFVLIVVCCVGAEAFENGALFHEPIDIYSGISLWPSILGYILVVVIASLWLVQFGKNDLTFKMPWNETASFLPCLSNDAKASAATDSQFLTFYDLRNLGEWLRSIVKQARTAEDLKKSKEPPEPKFDFDLTKFWIEIRDCCIGKKRNVASERHPTFVPINPKDRTEILSISRYAVFGLLLAVFVWQMSVEATWSQSPNWGILSLPPGRGGLEIALGTFFGTLALLLTLLVSTTALLQVVFLSRFIGALKVSWEGWYDSQSNTPPAGLKTLIQNCYWACDFVQNSSQKTIQAALWYPSLILLAFALTRLPIIDTWQLNSSTLILVAGIPIFLGLVSGIYLRVQSQNFRATICQLLTDWTVSEKQAADVAARNVDVNLWLPKLNLDFIKSTKQVVFEPSTKSPDNKPTDAKDVLLKIQQMNRGAFSLFWNDPVLGSFLFFATAIASQIAPQGSSFVQFLSRLVP